MTDGTIPAGDLIEAMRFDPVEGLCRLERHLARLKRSAQALGYAFDRHEARNALQSATFRLDAAACVRLLVARSGLMAIETHALRVPAAPVTIAIVAGERTAPELRTIGTDGHAVARAGAFDILFADVDGRLRGGSFTSLFAGPSDRLRTPPGGTGLLRAELIESGRATEACLYREDLADGFYVGNALIGLIPATLAPRKKTPDRAATPL